MKPKILSLMVLQGISKREMAAAARMGLSCFYKRLRTPDEFNVKELKLIAKKLKTTVSALTEGIK